MVSWGGLALGAYALGGGAIAAWAANGGLAIAGEYAVGGLAIGANANTAAAHSYFESSLFFSVAALAARYSRWLLVFVVIAPIINLFIKRQSGNAA